MLTSAQPRRTAPQHPAEAVDGARAFANIRVRGQCQGVGFRPFVYRTALGLGLKGHVRNDGAGVTVEAWGDARALDDLERRLSADAPSLARVDSVHRQTSQPRHGEAAPAAFSIAPSGEGEAGPVRITPDVATCPSCVAELLDPQNRRHRHALVNCTQCGPRFTIVRGLPYDRARTTMAGFALCARCEAEYGAPADRRFHAQPVCCPECGPGLSLTRLGGRALPGGEDPTSQAAHLLRGGLILAVKGLGGFHLAVDATRGSAVAELRRRKDRPGKPFAILVGSLDSARALCSLSAGAEAALVSPAAPIVIAPWRCAGVASAGLALADVAPGQHALGIMLPNTPLQHLLIAAHGGPLVMTSANASDEPLVQDDAELPRLQGIVDAVLTHDRPIARAVDDSVVLDVPARAPVPLRRARGYVPSPIPLPRAAPSQGLCLGADLKNAPAVVDGTTAILGQHVGDLSDMLAHRRLGTTLDDLCGLFEIEPAWVAVDMHPRYLSRRFGLRLAVARAIPTVVEVQHHHAHLASLLAEHGRSDSVVAVVCDGTGFGTDGTAWGGEVLVGDLTDFTRAAWLRPLRLPGGDIAAVETTRCTLSWIDDALGARATATNPHVRREVPDGDHRSLVAAMLARDVASPPSTSLGRLFDAAAGLLGGCARNLYEGMAAQRLESMACGSTARPDGSGLLTFSESEPRQLDHRPLLRALLAGLDQGANAADLAWLFHDAVADGFARAALAAARRHGVSTVGLTGGCFCNGLLTTAVAERIEAGGLELLTHRLVPPNDGGLALGQAAVAAARLRASSGGGG